MVYDLRNKMRPATSVYHESARVGSADEPMESSCLSKEARVDSSLNLLVDT